MLYKRVLTGSFETEEQLRIFLDAAETLWDDNVDIIHI